MQDKAYEGVYEDRRELQSPETRKKQKEVGCQHRFKIP